MALAGGTSFLYNRFKEAMLGKTYSNTAGTSFINALSSSNIYAALMLNSMTADRSLSTSGSISLQMVNRVVTAAVGTSLTNDQQLNTMEVSTSNNITFFNAANVVWPNVSTGAIIGGIMIYARKTSAAGDDSESLPLAMICLANATTANGASINVNWDVGVNRIFSLS